MLWSWMFNVDDLNFGKVGKPLLVLLVILDIFKFRSLIAYAFCS